MSLRRSTLVVIALATCAGHSRLPPAFAQPAAGSPQMPDAKQMSGRPLPVADLPVGTVTVRVVRESMSNVVPDHPVELTGGASPLTATTNEQGRAEFPGLRPGATVKAGTTVDGERIDSQPFVVPSSGGIRVALVATGNGRPGTAAESLAPAGVPARRGSVVLGAQTRIVIEMGDEALSVFNILEVVNRASTAVQPQEPLLFDLPDRAEGAGVLEGSGALATVAGRRVTLAGPFPPGSTLVQFGYSLPIRGPTLSFDQKLPVALAQFSMMAQKVGAMSVQSPQIAEHRDMPVQGQIFIVGKGPAVPAGGTISLAFSGLPHQPVWPRNVALGVAVAILLGGLWGTVRPRSRTGNETGRRRRLEAKRDRLFAELVATEEEHRAGNTDAGRYTARRRELVSALERLYAELDEEAAA